MLSTTAPFHFLGGGVVVALTAGAGGPRRPAEEVQRPALSEVWSAAHVSESKLGSGLKE